MRLLSMFAVPDRLRGSEQVTENLYDYRRAW